MWWIRLKVAPRIQYLCCNQDPSCRCRFTTKHCCHRLHRIELQAVLHLVRTSQHTIYLRTTLRMSISKIAHRIATSSSAASFGSTAPSFHHCFSYCRFPQNCYFFSALTAAASTIKLPKSVGIALAMSSSSATSQIFQTRLTQFVGQSRSSIHESILDTIGQTPIVKLQKLAPDGVNVYVKLESENPGGSIKDRLAMGAIEWAEQTGTIKPGQTVVEASSGNTGIGLAMVCAVKGYPLVCVMSEAFSVERRKLMRFLGAKVILTNPAHKATGMVSVSKQRRAASSIPVTRRGCAFDGTVNFLT